MSNKNKELSTYAVQLTTIDNTIDILLVRAKKIDDVLDILLKTLIIYDGTTPKWSDVGKALMFSLYNESIYRVIDCCVTDPEVCTEKHIEYTNKYGDTIITIDRFDPDREVAILGGYAEL